MLITSTKSKNLHIIPISTHNHATLPRVQRHVTSPRFADGGVVFLQPRELQVRPGPAPGTGDATARDAGDIHLVWQGAFLFGKNG